MKVRIQYARHGVMKFIGHLDMMRYFQKSMRRAEIDIAYSGGFSPHQIMSFASPLGVGMESESEYMDIEINSHQGGRAMRDALNAVMVPGMEILSVRALPQGAQNAMASVAAAGYLVSFRTGKPAFVTAETLRRFYEKEQIPFVKQTKKQQLTMDLKPAIYELSYRSMGNEDMADSSAITEAANDVIYMLVNASSSGNIKPVMVMEAFYRDNEETLPEFALAVTRTEIYGNRETADGKKLIPLKEAGEEF